MIEIEKLPYVEKDKIMNQLKNYKRNLDQKQLLYRIPNKESNNIRQRNNSYYTEDEEELKYLTKDDKDEKQNVLLKDYEMPYYVEKPPCSCCYWTCVVLSFFY